VYPETVSLMVSQEDAQRLRLGETKGRLSLTLRGIKDRDGVDPLLLTMTKDISQYKDEAGVPRPLSLGGSSGGVRVVRGTDVRKDASAKDGAPSPSFGFVPPATLGQ
jgi:Flp pilus assembly protein CpaB